MSALLRLDSVVAGYGEAIVLSDISLDLEEGGSLALLGRNGMGKTTLINTIMGLTRLHGGRVHLDGSDISVVPAHRRARAGLGWVPQEREVFPTLTVEENLTAVHRAGPWTLAKVYERFPRLAERRDNLGSQLSGGEQQMLAMGRALMTNPRILLLDEPLEGLAPIIVQDLLASITAMIREGGMAVILVEQHARQILPLVDRALVLDRGRIAHAGPASELIADETILDRWLGVGAH
jgi:branched-chain amino acid transport system ATP-binding protein